MMEQPVEKRRRHHAVAHHLGPGFEALVRGDDDRDLLIELADQVEEQVGFAFLDGDVADLVDDQDNSSGVKRSGSGENLIFSPKR